MTPEDEEFNRIEMESRIKQEYVRSMRKKVDDDFDSEYAKTMMGLMEELALARVLIRELGDRLAKLEKGNEPATCPVCSATAYPYPKCGCVFYKEKTA